MQISNGVLTATFYLKGAELCSLKDIATNREYIWQADRLWWPRHAPILFPIVGKLKSNVYKYEGKSYQMGQHGFARDMTFLVVEHQADSITFVLRDNEYTRQMYPFQFEFQVEYKLLDRILQTTFLVKNNGLAEMPFSFGGHPAFNTLPIENYFITFDKILPANVYFLKGGLITLKPKTLLGGQALWLTRNTFKDDAWIFLETKQTGITLNHVENGPVLTLNTGDFPYLGIWSKPRAPFVCVEPWQGTADWEDADGQIIKKKGIVVLEAGEEYSAAFSIEVF